MITPGLFGWNEATLETNKMAGMPEAVSGGTTSAHQILVPDLYTSEIELERGKVAQLPMSPVSYAM